MQGLTARQANFRSVCVFLKHPLDPSPLISEGVWQGEILETAEGTAGFGYDPIFYVPALKCSAAELSFDEKNRLSHRAIALKRLKDQLSLWCAAADASATLKDNVAS